MTFLTLTATVGTGAAVFIAGGFATLKALSRAEERDAD